MSRRHIEEFTGLRLVVGPRRPQDIQGSPTLAFGQAPIFPLMLATLASPADVKDVPTAATFSAELEAVGHRHVEALRPAILDRRTDKVVTFVLKSFAPFAKPLAFGQMLLAVSLVLVDPNRHVGPARLA